jgi:archaellum biogenesis ATPase FlaH
VTYINGHTNAFPDLRKSWPEVMASAPEQSFRLDRLQSVWDIEAHVTWLVEDVLVDQALNMITGESGLGKSTLALALAGAVAQGKPFLGYATKQRRVLYVDGENPIPVVRERLDRLQIPKLDNLDIWGGWCREHPPAGPDCKPVLGWAREHKGLIIYDSLIQFHPGSEQDSSETRKYLDHYRRLVNEGCAVILLHHTGKGENSKQYRGSSDIKAAADQAFCLELVGQSEEGHSSLRLMPFKSRMAHIKPLRFEMTSSGFQVSTYSGPTNRQIFEQIIAEKPDMLGGEIVKLAQARGIAKNRAEQLLASGAREGWLVVTVGPRNAKQYRLRGPND